VGADVIDQTCEFSKYRLLVAPMLYLLRPGAADRIGTFVAEGGTLVMTYWSGIVDASDLCFLGGWPGGRLREVLGVRDEETDALWPDEHNTVVFADGNALGLAGEYEARDLCALIHAETAEVLAAYGKDFYAGRPALTANRHGDGTAYYVASRNDEAFLDDFYGRLIADLGIQPALDTPLPDGVSAALRTDGQRQFVFLMNFSPTAQTVDLGTASLVNVLTAQAAGGAVTLDPYAALVLERG